MRPLTQLMATRLVRIPLVALLLLPQPVAPALIQVGGGCTLVDAIRAANLDAATGGCTTGSEGDVLLLTGDVALSSENPPGSGNGLPVVVSPIQILGNGFAIERVDGSPDFRIFEVGTDGSLILSGVAVRNGSTTLGGGGLLNGGQLILINSTVSGNSSSGSVGAGGIYNLETGNLVLVKSVVSDNDGGDCCGGGIRNEHGLLTLIESEVVANYGGWGAGVANQGSAMLYDSTISGNSGSDAGGISQYAPGSMTLVRSTVSGNSGGWAGGLYNGDGYPSATLINTTLSGNHSDGFGGGLFNSDGFVHLIHSTLSGNSAATGGGIYNGWGTPLTLTHSIVANSPSGDNCSGPGIVDSGNNFDDDGSCLVDGTITGLDPVLADNGGPTLTHALLDGSSAIDAAGDCRLETDQRGFPRDDGACDSGSVELEQGDPCALRIVMSSQTVQPGGTLEFALLLQHNRPQTATAPFRIWVEDPDGSFIVGRTTPPITFAPGDTLRRRLTLALPESLTSGPYFVRAEIDQMQQGVAGASEQILVNE